MIGPVAKHRYRYFAVGALGTFMATLDGSIVNVALPTIATSLNVSVDLVSWVVLAYTLTLISLMLVFGTLTQRKGYAFGYRFGFVFFLIGSAACSFAPTIEYLLAGRVLQAVGTAMFAAIGPGMVTTIFPREERGKGIGLMVMMVSAGFMAGPPLGGFMLSIWPWQSIFLINLPIGCVGLLLVHLYFSGLKPPNGGHRTRFRGAIAMSIALVATVFLLKLVNTLSWHHPLMWALAIVAVISIGLFIRFESQPKSAMIGLGIFRNRNFTIAIATQQLHFIALSGVLILGPFYLERVQGLAPKQVAWYLLILPVLMFAMSPLAGWLSDRLGSKLPTTIGMTILTCGLFLFSNFGVDTSSMFIVLSLIAVGLGVGSFSSPNSSALMGSVSEEDRAVTSSILATNRNIGHAFGVAIATTLFSYFESLTNSATDPRAAFVASFQPVVHVAIGFGLLGILLCFLRPGKKDSKMTHIPATPAGVASPRQ